VLIDEQIDYMPDSTGARHCSLVQRHSFARISLWRKS